MLTFLINCYREYTIIEEFDLCEKLFWQCAVCLSTEFITFFYATVLLADLMKDRPHKTEGFDSVIVVDGVPQVGPERFEKLQSFITKIYSKFGEIVNEYYPKNENGQTKGWAHF